MKPPVLLALLVAAVVETAAAGATFVVNSAADAPDANTADGVCQTATPGACTLRAAVQQANATALDPDVVQVPAMTITLSQGALVVTSPISIQGSGRAVTVVGANRTSRVFHVSHGLLSLSKLTVRDGDAGSDIGGCILSDLGIGGSLSLDDVLVTHCYAGTGAGVYSFTSETPPKPSGASRAAAAREPAAVQQPSLLITHSVLSDCHAGTGGGALALVNDAILKSSTFHGNFAGAGGGGGILVASPFYVSSILNCTISGNTATSGSGGGISLTGGGVSLQNTTVAYNVAEQSYGGGVAGAGLTVNISHSIVAYNERSGGQLLFPDDCAGSVSVIYASIVPNPGSGCSINGPYSTANPLLGFLRDNGGPSPTLPLLQNSPAIDAGATGGCGSFEGYVLEDQRGVQRASGAPCDLGAYERSPCGDVNGDGTVNVADVLFLINHLFAGGPVPPGLANVNQDSERNVSDVLYLINALFAGGPAPVCPGT